MTAQETGRASKGLRCVVLLGLLSVQGLVFAEAGPDTPPSDEDAIGEYLSIRDELMLEKTPEELDHSDVMGAVASAKDYLFHALERDNRLHELFRAEDNRENVFPAFKRYFAEQADRYKQSYAGTVVHFKRATDAELAEGREAYRSMAGLIRRSDAFVMKVLDFDFGKLALAWQQGGTGSETTRSDESLPAGIAKSAPLFPDVELYVVRKATGKELSTGLPNLRSFWDKMESIPFGPSTNKGPYFPTIVFKYIGNNNGRDIWEVYQDEGGRPPRQAGRVSYKGSDVVVHADGEFLAGMRPASRVYRMENGRSVLTDTPDGKK